MTEHGIRDKIWTKWKPRNENPDCSGNAGQSLGMFNVVFAFAILLIAMAFSVVLLLVEKILSVRKKQP